jgi:hypothetical protein
MIEQTALNVTEWHYHPPMNPGNEDEKLACFVTFDVMKKRASKKKGIACRFSCRYVIGKETILEYIADDSYVIDLEDHIDKHELMIMIRNSYSKFNDEFDSRKMGTFLQNKILMPLDETTIDHEPILQMLL